jgi:hypothetical protein
MVKLRPRRGQLQKTSRKFSTLLFAQERPAAIWLTSVPMLAWAFGPLGPDPLVRTAPSRPAPA